MVEAINDDALASALRYARRGWYVFPVEPGTKKSLKSAKYSGGMKWGNTVDEAEIRKNFAQWPNAGVGIMTGPESGIFVVDVDSPEGHIYNGIANWDELQDRHGSVPPTLIAKSPTGGVHYFFKYPMNGTIKNSSSQLAPGIDIKGNGGIVLAAPTPKFREGVEIGRYEWINSNPVAEAPGWLLAALFALTHRTPSREESRQQRTTASIEDIKTMLEVIPNEDRPWDDWNRIAMTIFHVTNGSNEGLILLKDWSAKSEKYQELETENRWREIRGSPPRELTVATLIYEANKSDPNWRGNRAISIEQFYCYMPDNTFIWNVNGSKWFGKGVDKQLAPMALLDDAGQPLLDANGRAVKIKASEWLARNRRIHAKTWAPGEHKVVEDKIIDSSGWKEQAGAKIYNLYDKPNRVLGNATKAGKWLELVDILTGEHREHFLNWMAFKVQNPGLKINHALVLGGAGGIGKDTMMNPIQDIIGEKNFANANPHSIMSNFNGYAQAVILRINEARDLGDVNRYQFYERMKTIIAAPPEVIVINEKFTVPYNIPNVVGVIYTTNYKTNGLYIPPDDRRHYVIWSEVVKTDFPNGYFDEMWSWFDIEGYTAIAAYMHERDISKFNPMTPPKITEAFLTMVEGGATSEDHELSDLIDHLGRAEGKTDGGPDAITPKMIKDAVFDNSSSFREWIEGPHGRRQLPHKMEMVGYTSVRNHDAKDGMWRIGNRRTTIYCRRELSPEQQRRAALALNARVSSEQGPRLV